jgi:hypothetical protein
LPLGIEKLSHHQSRLSLFLFPRQHLSHCLIAALSVMIDRTKLSGSELLVALLAYFPQSDFKMHDTSDLIRALHTVKAEDGAEEFFANYAFEEEGRYPDSRVLSEALESLQHTTLLRRENPYLVNYSVSPALKRYFDERVKVKVSNEQKLKELSEKVFNLVKESYSPISA